MDEHRVTKVTKQMKNTIAVTYVKQIFFSCKFKRFLKGLFYCHSIVLDVDN